MTPRNCEIEQLVRYQESAHGGYVLIDQDLVDHMDNLNQAALYIHEAFYAFLRPSEKSSLRVRRAVGLSFSGHKFKTLESFLPREYYDCWSSEHPYSRVMVYVPEKGFCANEGVSYQIVNAAGLFAFDFEEPASCQHTTLEEVFTKPFPMRSYRSLGRRVDFDYTVDLNIGGANGAKQVTLELKAAPDQAASEKSILNCELKNN